MRQAGLGWFFGEATAGSVSAEGRLGRGGSPELEEVVGQANERPFGFHLGDAPPGEWAETAGGFDLTAVFIHRKTGPARLVPFVSGRSHAPFWFAAYGPDAASG